MDKYLIRKTSFGRWLLVNVEKQNIIDSSKTKKPLNELLKDIERRLKK